MRSIAVVLAATLSTTAAADPATATRLAGEAQALGDAGDFAKAAIKFRSAYESDPRPSLICNAGVAYYKAKDLTRAHYYLGRCLKLADKLEAGFVTSLRKAIAAVTTKLEAARFPRIELVPDPGDATITVEGATSPFDEPVVAGIVWVPPGQYKLTFHAAGHTDKSHVVDVKSDQTITENVQLAAATTTPPIDDTKPVDTKPIATPIAPRIDPPIQHPHRPALIAAIATGVIGVAAIASYAWASHQASAAGSATTQPDYDAAKSSALSYQHASWILGGVAGVGAIASGVLWYLAPSANLEVQATSTGGSISWGGRF